MLPFKLGVAIGVGILVSQFGVVEAQNCESDLSEYSISNRESAVVQIRTTGDPIGVHGTATLIHSDGVFLTAAHTIIDYDPERLEIATVMASQPEYVSKFKPSIIVYPSRGVCANYQDARNRCKYRSSEEVLAKYLGITVDKMNPELDFAIIVADKKPPRGMVPFPIRGGSYAKDHIKFWGYPADASVGPTNQIELIQNTADYVGESQGFPLYRPTYAQPGLSGSLMVDGKGRGFGITRRRKAIAATIEIENGDDIPEVDDANQLFAVPINVFFEAGLLDNYKTNVIENLIANLQSPPTNPATREPFTTEEVIAFYKGTEWSLLDSLGLDGLLSAHTVWTEQEAWPKAIAALVVAMNVTKGTCIQDDSSNEDISILIAEVSGIESVRSRANTQPYETRVALFELAQATDWGNSLNANYSDQFAAAVSQTFSTGFDVDALSVEQRSQLAYMTFKADTSIPAREGVASPIEYAVQLDAAPYILDQYAIRSDREKDDLVSAFVALLAAQGKLEEKYELSDQVTEELQSFRSVTDANVEYFKNRLLSRGSLSEGLTAKLREGSISPGDLYDLTDPALVKALSQPATDG